MATVPEVTEIVHRVDYSETDQMGVVYHARYLVWLDIARTEYLRARGASYRVIEEEGYRLVVGEAAIRYRLPARYDDEVRVRVWVREQASRRVSFGYAIERAADGVLLASAWTSLIVLDAAFRPIRLPPSLAGRLHPTPDLVRVPCRSS